MGPGIMALQKPFAVYPLDLGTITTGDELSNRPAAHLKEFKHAGMIWETALASSIWVRCDLGSAKDIDFVALLGTNATETTRIRIRLGDSQAEVDGTADYDSGYIAIRTPAITREDGKYHSFHRLPSLQTKRWIRIDADLHTDGFSAMALVVGKALDFSNFYSPLNTSFGQEDYGELSFDRFGVVDDVPGNKMRILEMDFGWMADADRANKFQPLRDKIGTTGMAYWCFDPDATVQRQDKQYFGHMLRPAFFKPSMYDQSRWQSQFQIRSII